MNQTIDMTTTNEEGADPNVKLLNDKRYYIIEEKNNSIWIDHEGVLCWQINHVPVCLEPFIQECKKLKSLIMTSVSRRHWWDLSFFLGTQLSVVLSSSSEIDVELLYSNVRKCINEKAKEIRSKFAQSADFVIYIKSNGGIEWWHRNLPDRLKPVINEWNRLDSIIYTSLPIRYQKDSSLRLAATLASALRNETGQDIIKDFEDVKTYILNRVVSHLRFEYFKTSLIIVASILSLALIILPFIEGAIFELAIGGISGIIGAFVSTLQRANKMDIDPMSTTRDILLQGCTRLIVGFIFGLFVVCLSKSKVGLGTISDNIYALAVFAMISGVSERVMPDTIENLSVVQSSSKFDNC